MPDREHKEIRLPALLLDEFLQEREDICSKDWLQKRQAIYLDDSLQNQETCRQLRSKKDLIRIQVRKVREQLSLEQKAALCCGRQNGSGGEFIGNSFAQVPGAAGETTTILEEAYQVSSIVMADGPAGLRLQQCFRGNERIPSDTLAGSGYEYPQESSLWTEF